MVSRPDRTPNRAVPAGVPDAVVLANAPPSEINPQGRWWTLRMHMMFAEIGKWTYRTFYHQDSPLPRNQHAVYLCGYYWLDAM